MPSKSYSIDQLLALRVQQSPGALPSLAENHPELATIIRHRKRVNSTMKKETTQRQTDFSTSSDESMPKENALPQPALASSTASSLSTATALPSGRETAWKYRGRSDSEATNAEPVSAPTGLQAQKSEGFQRFYKAVVSPTHVRVTAGGRIVPNTRGPPSPTAKRVAGNAAQDSLGEKHANVNANAKPNPAPQSPAQQMPSNMPQYFPGFPSAFPPVPAFLPMPFPPTIPGGFPFPLLGGHMMQQHLPDHATRDMRSLHTGDGQTDKAAEPNKEGSARPPKPEHFDPAKPYLYNNPWMFPMGPPFPHPAGGPFMPGPMFGHSPFMGHPPMPPMFPPPNVGMSAPGAGDFPSQMPPQPGFAGSAATPGPANKTVQSPATPPISSIKPSEITKKQIASFRASLKYHEDQLQYNRHQIDEKAMESKVKSIQEHIQHFDTLLQSQLGHERAYYPKSEKARDTDTDSHTAPNAAQGIQDQSADGDYTQAAGSAHKDRHHSPEVADTFTGIKGGQTMSNFETPALTVESADPIKQTSLPTDAALAPPFRPRGEAQSQADANNSDMWGKPDVSRITQGGSDPSLLSASDRRWQIFSGSSDLSTEASSKACESSIAEPTNVVAPTRARARLGVPYLIGTLPKGMDSRTARDTDYQYARELTEDEIRARHLYWGKAPSFVQLGLPKYDGRNFYPPSPVGGSTACGSAEKEPPSFVNRLPVETAEEDRDLERPKPAVDRIRPADPFRLFVPTRRNNMPKALSSDDAFPLLTRDRSLRGRVRIDSEDLEQPAEESGNTARPPQQKPTCTNTHADAKSATSSNKRSDKPGVSKFPPTVLRKGCTSSAVSSTTAHGFLPQYSSYASKSLSPPFHKPAFSPNRDESPTKTSDIDLSDGGALLSPIPEKKGENRPPNGEGSLEEQFRTVVSVGLAGRGNLSSTLNL